MERKLLTYEEKDTWIDKLCGVTKLVFFLCWSVTSMMTYDTRILVLMLVLSLIIFKISRTRWDQVGSVFKFILLFLIINLLAIYLFSPAEGVKIYGTETVLAGSGRYALRAEQLFYEFNIMLKYFTVVPSIFIFIVTTNPSEFAASMNRVGISYKAGYSVAIALRYIPDIQADFRKIRNAQMARGIEMSKKGKLVDRIKSTTAIIFPLVFSSMGRIETISTAMELRSFGKHRKRTWYMARPLKRNDYLVIAISVLFMIVALTITYMDGSRFYNPFV
ncbi:MAG: energy-coupling factor transporter transmembrane protein EcfT [Lachnospiraceae bacterium]|nr:energy-coupling factor transporter transmembrane protein EcfT [Lachnospiraceae bacterium]